MPPWWSRGSCERVAALACRGWIHRAMGPATFLSTSSGILSTLGARPTRAPEKEAVSHGRET
eukprot:7805266-Prorocentrum_lima.AAC.1